MDYKKTSSLDSNDRVPQFRKDPIHESFIESINENLEPLEQKLRLQLDQKNKSFPSLVVTGMARTGSTLLTQVLASRLNVGYVSNLMARFYKNPLVGSYLQKIVIGDQIHQIRDYRSTFGVTNQVYEPHEFGYFWASQLSTNENCHEFLSKEEKSQIDFKNLNEQLKMISKSFNRPVIYKCTIAQLNLDFIMSNTNIFVIHITRDLDPTIKSVIKARKERLGDESKWWSIRPKGFEQLSASPPYEQVRWQFERVEEAISHAKTNHDSRIFTCNYSNLVDQPELVLDQLVEKYQAYSSHTLSRTGEAVILK